MYAKLEKEGRKEHERGRKKREGSLSEKKRGK